MDLQEMSELASDNAAWDSKGTYVPFAGVRGRVPDIKI